MTFCAQQETTLAHLAQDKGTLLDHIDRLNRRVGTRLRLDSVMGALIHSARDYTIYSQLVQEGSLISRDGYVWVSALEGFDYNRSCGYLDSVLKGWQDDGVSNDVLAFLTSDPGIYIPPEYALRVLAEYRGMTIEDAEYEFIQVIMPNGDSADACTVEHLSRAINGIFNCSIETSKPPFNRIVEKAMNEFRQRRCDVLNKRLGELESELDAVRNELKTLGA